MTWIYHPKNLPSITCAIAGDGTAANYHIDPNSIDMAEGKREEIVYSEGKRGGIVRGVKAGLATVKHRVWIFGSSETDAMANARTLKQAIVHQDGGYLEYVPLGWSGVMSTYYHYLQSHPPTLTKGGVALCDLVMERYGIVNESAKYGVVIDVELTVWAWATSNPESPATLVSGTVISNHDDTGENDYVTILSSSIKGDVVFPIVQILAASPNNTQKVIVYKKEEYAGANINVDWVEGEDCDGGLADWASGFDPGNVSNDWYTITGVASPEILPVTPSLNGTYLGKISPIIFARTSDGTTTYEVYIEAGMNPLGTIGGLLAGNQVTKTLEVNGTTWMGLYEFGELDFGNVPVPKHITENSVPAVGAYIGAQACVHAARTAGSGELHIDAIVLAKANEWIALVEGTGWLADDAPNNEILVLDSVVGVAHQLYDSDDTHHRTWSVEGANLLALVCRKGFDARLRFIFLDALDVYDFDLATTVTITGLHGTIYPFEVA